jgi:hypothetical protein
MFCFSCVKVPDITGTIHGKIIVQPATEQPSGVHLETWPGDTTSITVCLLDAGGDIIITDDENEKCKSKKMNIEGEPSDPGETWDFKFDMLPWGTYHLGIYYQCGGTGPQVEKVLITYYHSELETKGAITDFAESEAIILSLDNRIADLRDILITYGVK